MIRPNAYENRPSSFDRPSSYDRPSRPQHDYHYSSGPSYNYANKDSNHPLTYPGSGEGEWVLVSTTKGYQFPKRHGQRAMLFQAQNGVHGSDTKKHDTNGIITAASQQHEISVRPPFHSPNTLRPPHGPTKMTQQHVKLTVLPLFNKNENRPIQNQNNQHHQSGGNNMEVNVYKPSKYNGIIETEPSTQTIEESVAAAANANEANALSATAPKASKKKKIRTRNYAVMRKNVNGDSTAVLAAVSTIFGKVSRLLNLFDFLGRSRTPTRSFWIDRADGFGLAWVKVKINTGSAVSAENKEKTFLIYQILFRLVPIQIKLFVASCFTCSNLSYQLMLKL